MNLIEALSSGRPIRRPKWIGGYLPLKEVENFAFSVEDLLATDWEVEEKQITITISQFNKAWSKATTKHNRYLVYESLIEELGL